MNIGKSLTHFKQKVSFILKTLLCCEHTKKDEAKSRDMDE